MNLIRLFLVVLIASGLCGCCTKENLGKFSLKTEDKAVVPYSKDQIVRFRDEAFALAKCTVVSVLNEYIQVPVDQKGCQYFETERINAEIICPEPPLNLIVGLSMPGTFEVVNTPDYRARPGVYINGILHAFPSPFGTCSGSDYECFPEIELGGKVYQNVVLSKVQVPVADSVNEVRLYYNAAYGIIDFSFPDGKEYILE
ncbi:MAG: hypothetical protein K1X92_01850 [Bacteroidia bacterium]|nr:hypothetical protein [Bacteroidia bacterium]